MIRMAATNANKKIAKSSNTTSSAIMAQEFNGKTNFSPWNSVGGFGGFSAEVIPEASEERACPPVIVDSPIQHTAIPASNTAQFEALIDSGASYNYAKELTLMNSYMAFETPIEITLASGMSTPALGLGVIGVLPFMYTPGLVHNLVSVAAMADLGIVTDLHHNGTLHGCHNLITLE